jgi:hypothetical protein
MWNTSVNRVCVPFWVVTSASRKPSPSLNPVVAFCCDPDEKRPNFGALHLEAGFFRALEGFGDITLLDGLRCSRRSSHLKISSSIQCLLEARCLSSGFAEDDIAIVKWVGVVGHDNTVIASNVVRHASASLVNMMFVMRSPSVKVARPSAWRSRAGLWGVVSDMDNAAPPPHWARCRTVKRIKPPGLRFASSEPQPRAFARELVNHEFQFSCSYGIL